MLLPLFIAAVSEGPPPPPPPPPPPVEALAYAAVRDVMPIGGRLVVADLPDKRAGETLSYAFDMRPFLRGRSITAVSFEAYRGRLSLANARIDGTKVAVDVSGGFTGDSVRLVATVTLSDGSVVMPSANVRMQRDYRGWIW